MFRFLAWPVAIDNKLENASAPRAPCKSKSCTSAQMLHTHTRLYTKKLLLTDSPTASTQGSFYGEDFFTGKLLQTTALYTQKLLLREACKQSSFTHRSFYTHTKKRTAFSQSSFYTLKPLLVRTHKPLRKGTLHTRGGTLHNRFYTQQLSHRSLYTDQLLHSEDFARRRLYTKKL